MQVTGKVFKILPQVSGSGTRGEWVRQDVVFECIEGTYTRKIALTFFNKAEDVQKLREGVNCVVDFNYDCRESNGKWYNSLTVWRLNIGNNTTQAQPTQSAPAQSGGSFEQPF